MILTGVAFDGGLRGMRFAGPGVVFAVVALVLFAVMTIGSDIVLERTGWVQVLLVSRREQRRDEDHVGDLRAERRDRRIRRVDEEQVGVGVLADDPLEHAALPQVWFDCEYQRHVRTGT